MKPSLTLTALVFCLASAQAQMPGHPKSPKERPQTSGSANYRPAVPEQQPAPLPDRRPSTRPAPEQPVTQPVAKPGKPSTLPSLPSQGGHGTRPAWPDQPQTLPERPGRPTTRPNPLPEQPGRPTTRPMPLPEQPELPTTRPVPLPEQPGRPTTRPMPLPEYPPPRPTPQPERPGRPVTKPWPHPDDDDFLDIHPQPLPEPVRPGRPYPGRPGKPWPEYPTTKPVDPGVNRPPVTLPIHRPPRPRPTPQITNIWENHTHVWNNWTVQNNITINNFVVQRPNYWTPVQEYCRVGRCWQHYGRPDWVEWRSNYWDYRRYRCQELWNSFYWVAGQLFDNYWWSHCQWAGRPVPGDVPAWWWWQPVSWESIVRHVNFPARAREPISRDPGVNIVLQNGRVYIDGVDSWPDWKYVQSTRTLASSPWPWEPPFPGGRYQWLPLGVWALAPVEQGDATMFLQISISREGWISGAYTNALTGEDLPIKGCANLSDQRVAFYIGDRPDTVIETGLAQFMNDVTGAFLHHRDGRSSEWLLTRIPGPGSNPGPVRVPTFR